ncbi:hypothetical protein IAR55_003126 [Kwoniella newhampshirensis]|uniref:glucan endo-1,3-beta-D-glucosidase n=1 Tax=Kwoniella newhampshirensis TaxID=1651941 RepID=A0AAW0Z1H9_9TREE
MSGQRYTPVPGFGAEQRNSGYGFDDYDSRYPTPQRLSSYSTTPFHDRTPSTQSFKELPPPPHSATVPTAGLTMPLMSEFPSSSRATTGPRGGYFDPTSRQNIPSEHYYPMSDPSTFTDTRPARSGNKRKMLIWGGAILGVLALIGIIVGVVVSQVKKNNNSSGNSSGSSASTNGTNGSTLSNPNDPSKFAKDSNLHQSFWGFAYTPNLAQVPWCGATQTNVTRDIQLLSQITTRLRLYGANCNQTALVLQAIQDTKVNMTVWLGIYVDSNQTAYTTQLEAVTDALKTYGTDHVSGVTVGNEYILNTAGTTSTTSSAYISSVGEITDKIAEVNTTIQGLNLSKTLPIGTSDAGSIMSTRLASGVDYFMANVHPWFGSLPIDQAAEWTNTYFQETDVAVAATADNNPTCYIAETGWPTQSMNASEANDGAGSPQGDASVANLQTFLDTFVCQANANGTEYFYFEAFDEPWKAQFGGVEPYWGLFDSNRNLKEIKIPVC